MEGNDVNGVANRYISGRGNYINPYMDKSTYTVRILRQTNVKVLFWCVAFSPTTWLNQCCHLEHCNWNDQSKQSVENFETDLVRSI